MWHTRFFKFRTSPELSIYQFYLFCNVLYFKSANLSNKKCSELILYRHMFLTFLINILFQTNSYMKLYMDNILKQNSYWTFKKKRVQMRFFFYFAEEP